MELRVTNCPVAPVVVGVQIEDRREEIRQRFRQVGDGEIMIASRHREARLEPTCAVQTQNKGKILNFDESVH